MRVRVMLLTGVAILIASQPTTPQENKENLKAYQEWMKEAGATVGAIKKNIETNTSEVAKGASRLSELFDEVESFWIRRDMEDAQEWAANLQDAADELAEAAESGNKSEAMAAFKTMTGNCSACHNAHREKLPDGTFGIK